MDGGKEVGEIGHVDSDHFRHRGELSMVGLIPMACSSSLLFITFTSKFITTSPTSHSLAAHLWFIDLCVCELALYHYYQSDIYNIVPLYIQYNFIDLKRRNSLLVMLRDRDPGNDNCMLVGHWGLLAVIRVITGIGYMRVWVCGHLWHPIRQLYSLSLIT